MLKCLHKILEMIGSAGRAMRPGIVDVLGQWELSLIFKKDGVRNGTCSVFHLLCKVSSDYRWINSN